MTTTVTAQDNGQEAGQPVSSHGNDPHRAEGVAMIIRCETGEHVQIDAEDLVGATLAGLNLHRALLERRDLQRADLSGTDLRSARLEGANLAGC